MIPIQIIYRYTSFFLFLHADRFKCTSLLTAKAVFKFERQFNWVYLYCFLIFFDWFLFQSLLQSWNLPQLKINMIDLELICIYSCEKNWYINTTIKIHCTIWSHYSLTIDYRNYFTIVLNQSVTNITNMVCQIIHLTKLNFNVSEL